MRIALVQMPPLNDDRPSLGLSLVASAARSSGHTVEMLYSNLHCAHSIGVDLYRELCGAPNDSLLADIAFVRAVNPTLDIQPLMDILNQRMGEVFDVKRLGDTLERAYAPLSRFLDEETRRIASGSYDVIGLTAVFALFPTIIAIKKLREHGFDGEIILGGSHCEGPMGPALLELVPELDHVVRGYAEQSFPALLHRISCGQSAVGVPGVVTRHGSQVVAGPAAAPLHMDALPRVDYRHWFAEREALGLGKADTAWVPVETARGCWYGQAQQCTFCGLNGEQIAFASKSAERAFEEFRDVAESGGRFVYTTDPIIERSYFGSLLPKLAEAQLPLTIFYEVKSNISDNDVRALSQAGVRAIQPGIESLSSHVLQLMRKGVRPYQNIRVLISAARHGVGVGWNLLYGFPDEEPEDYDAMEALIPLLYHLEPPGIIDGAGGWVRLDRFSPMFNAPHDFGLENVRPHPIFADLWDAVAASPDARSVFDACYYFDYEYSDGRTPRTYVTGVMAELQRWHAVYPQAFLVGATLQGKLWVLDTRDPSDPRRLSMSGVDAWLLTACASGASPRRIAEESISAGFASREVADALDRLTDLGLLVLLDQRYLSLVVRLDEFVPAEFPVPLVWSALEVAAKNRMASPTPNPLATRNEREEVLHESVQ